MKVADLLGSQLDCAANCVARGSLPRVPVYVVSPPSCFRTGDLARRLLGRSMPVHAPTAHRSIVFGIKATASRRSVAEESHVV